MTKAAFEPLAGLFTLAVDDLARARAEQRNVAFRDYSAFRTTRRLDHGAGDDVFEAILVRQREAFAPFMETLDGRAIEAARILARREGERDFGMQWLRLHWGDLDRAGGPPSPLAVAIRAYPGLSATPVWFWRDPPLLFRDLSTREVASTALLARGRSFDPRDGSGERRSLSDALATRIPDEASNMTKFANDFENAAKWQKIRAWESDGYPDQALGFFAGLLSRLPVEWTPEGAEEWSAFLAVSHVVEWVLDGVPDGVARARLNLSESWAGLAMRAWASIPTDRTGFAIETSRGAIS